MSETISDYPIRLVRGNYFQIAQPLSKITWEEGIQSSEDYVPAEGDVVKVALVRGTKRWYMDNVTIEDNILYYDNNGTLDVGTYDIEVRVVEAADGRKLRSYQTCRIRICYTNAEAGITDGDEFDVSTYEISSAVLLVMKGEKGNDGTVSFDELTPAQLAMITGRGVQSIILNADNTITVTYTDGTSYTSDSLCVIDADLDPESNNLVVNSAIATAIAELEAQIGAMGAGSPFINLNELLESTDAYTLTTAIEALLAYETETDKTYRKSGLVITYLLEDGTWQSKQFFGADIADFTDETLWDDFGGSADEEFSETSEKPVQNKTVTAAIERLNAAVFPFTINLSGGGTYEKGSTQTVNLGWSYSDAITSQSINGSALAADARSASFNGVTSTTTYTLSAVSGGTTYTKSVTATFRLRKYFGANANSELSDADILALSNAWATAYTMGETSLDCSGGKYIYYIIPTSLAPAGLPDFRVGGFANSDWEVTTQDVTNASGYTESYTIYRLRNIQTGSAITLQVK